MGFIPATTVVHKWFMSKRGVVMGLVNSGAGFGGLIFAPLMSVLVAHFGWRHALYVLAVIILVLGVPSIWLKRGPREVGQWVDGVEGRIIPEQGRADAIGTVQASLGKMARSPLFWMIFLIFGIESWALGVYAADQVLYLKTIGRRLADLLGCAGGGGGYRRGVRHRVLPPQRPVQPVLRADLLHLADGVGLNRLPQRA